MRSAIDTLQESPSVSIRAVSQLLGVPIPTIRSWEKRYGIPAVRRTTGGHRRYSLADVEEIRAMRDEVGRGRSARSAAEMVREHRSTHGRPDRDFVVRFLEGAHRLYPELVEDALKDARTALGLEAALTKVVLPGMREVGLHWQVGVCDVAHEHLATEVTRRWLSRVAASLPRGSVRPPIVLGCGPKDLHTIGLETFAVLLSRRGYACRVLGQQVPADSLVKATRMTDAVGVVVTSHVSLARKAAVEALARLSRIRSAHVFYAGNAFIASSSRRGVRGEYLGDDMLVAADLLLERVSVS
jgi:DNA-binding transcriptional MerR regulator